MALTEFSCVATGPFLLCRETAERIFKAIGEPFFTQGGFTAEDLPEILRKLDAAAEEDRRREAELEAERERRLREGSYEDEIRALEQEAEEKERRKHREDSVRLYQRIAPLQDMIRRAIRHDKGIMWTELGR